MAKPIRSDLFDRRLLVNVGKGGVGKTTVSCLLGLLAAQRGKKTLIAEVDGAGRAARLLGAQPGEVGMAQTVRPLLSVMSVEGSAALAEYLQIILPVKRVIQAVLASRIYQYFVAAAPGLKELMTIGKIWYEAERIDDASGERSWDLVILDAPATGHSMQYLSMPRAAHEVFRSGLVGRESQRLVDLLSDPLRTAVNLITTAEEMPVNEAIEMYGRLTEDLQMPLGYLFINRVHRAEFDEDAIAQLGDPARLADPKDRALAAEVIRRAREEAGWTAINASYLQKLRDCVPLPAVELPYVYAEEFGVEQVRDLVAVMDVALGASGRRSGKHARA
ncbi:MAG: ArsA family ATPase [Deltaproteobacteria bacterium]|nr:ArsA family ATPase [Deltaproteobacteria bacterium]